ncbi:MAG: nucleotide exchange factor GrpE [Methylococcaceae bacterium]|nr:nucleotide exchange factor GrpE [Methylococcaceae bacterium]
MSQDDVLPEEPTQNPEDADNAEPILIDSPEQLTDQLARANQLAEENWEKFVRTQAELENLKRRAEKDLQHAHKFGLEKFARELLPVADSLELGLSVETSDTPEVHKLREGMDLTLKQLLSSLEKFNVIPIDPLGEKFDPERHQAMAMQPTDEAEPNTVIKVYQKGYLISDRLLRPAMVVVAQSIG